ncbi:class I SAM-dependent methyltransferase [Kineosporia sp. NBRC 101731]|uniref:class I SAM-dependent methyltransferase n=1 Tax=Kineosporia sp. NBRC 101731 TaxID=3032199 RepID=UPI0024A47430|nr:class I SAM-dependent methyltransferase [Kineosporia sp. NBRC 101731]GLY30680.1 hypothetical protein Kisp02_40450 [Kineosporia sp. NBRC 101731]
MRDYVSWHDVYSDPDSALSWRLSRVRHHITEALNGRPGEPITAVSLCAGDGRDLIGVLSARPDADRVEGALVELHPELAARARTAVGERGLRIKVLTADAGAAEAYAGLVPADLVLMVGIFGNLTDEDLEGLIRAAPAFCRPGATLIWSRGRDDDIGDLNDTVRGWFAKAGFSELAYETREGGEQAAMGVVRYSGDPVPMDFSRRLFSFIR